MELRKDYILDRWVILSEGRGARPKQFKEKETIKEVKKCFFCPGSEELTPQEVGRLGDPWRMRWFPNKFPAVRKEGNPTIKTDNNFFTFADAYGAHEVLVETNDHKKQLWDLPAEHINDLFRVYKERISQISQDDKVKYVSVFKNHGRKGGTSLLHSHSQIIGYNTIPKGVREEVEARGKFDYCPYCSIITVEKESHRRCFENERFVAFTPYASRFNYEIWIFPKEHLRSLSEFSDDHFTDLSHITHQTLSRLKELGSDFNYFIHYSPAGEDLHFHIEITPRIATWAGFELSGAAVINSVSPEIAASFYRGEN